MTNFTCFKLVLQKLSVIILFMGIGLVSASGDTNSSTNWGYTGATDPAHWGKLSPEYLLCSVGMDQSPINIDNAIRESNNTLKIEYNTSVLLNEIKTSHTIEFVNSTAVNTPEIKYSTQRYHLLQFHFHIPSENQIANKTYPMEIHFVNQAANGKILVLAIFIEEGSKENSSLEKIIRYLSATASHPDQKSSDTMTLNLSHLLPLKKAYYQFIGSLTTPPCTEGVTWVVMKQPIEASTSQMNKFRELLGSENARPVQQLHNRTIIEVN